MEGDLQGALWKELRIAPFALKQLLSEDDWNVLLKHCISIDFLLVKGYVQDALLKELLVDLILDPFKTTALGKSYW